MSEHTNAVLKLEKNPKEIYDETRRLLIKIADNILKEPQNEKFRILQKDNATISKKIMGVYGGLDCLLQMGFQENGSSLKLPAEASLSTLAQLRKSILKSKGAANSDDMQNPGISSKTTVMEAPVKPTHHEKENIKRLILPRFHSDFINPFLRDVALKFHIAQIHDDRPLQERAKNLIPVRNLELAAQNKLRTYQEEIKKHRQDLDISLQDMLILELLSWFKDEFFSWIDNPACEQCNNKDTKFSHMCTDHNMMIYTNRIEMYKCEACSFITPFPRYNDLNILLETRRGRCGEWANTFTLFCRAMGWDARHVFDETDHVWTEVFSFAQDRWLHCDPCENACDTPLMYESGWKKEISYVMAYSGEEVQDVTWRYCSDHKLVMRRRNKCTEDELIAALIALRQERQKRLSDARRKYLTKRLLTELVELMVARKANEKDQQGRISGSLAWRMSRGEFQADAQSYNFVWKFEEDDIAYDFVSVQYSTAQDQYERILGSTGIFKIVPKWSGGVFQNVGLFRKEEKDWKVAYLSRKEGVIEGQVSWKFEVDSVDYSFDQVRVDFDYTLFEDGRVDVIVSDGNSRNFHLDGGTKSLETGEFAGGKVITVTAILTGGKGDVGWQHAQLFRQNLNNNNHYPFKVMFSFRRFI